MKRINSSRAAASNPLAPEKEQNDVRAVGAQYDGKIRYGEGFLPQVIEDVAGRGDRSPGDDLAVAETGESVVVRVEGRIDRAFPSEAGIVQAAHKVESDPALA